MRGNGLPDFASDLLEEALRRGAEAAEVFGQRELGRRIIFQDRSVDTVDVSESLGFALRVMSGGKSGFFYLANPGKDDVRRAAVEALASARLGDEPAVNLPDAARELPPVEGIFDESFFGRDDARAVRLLEREVEAAFAASCRIRKVRKATFSETWHVTHLANSNGFRASKEGTHYSLAGSVVAGDGDMQEMASEWSQARIFEELAGRGTLTAAATRADAMLGAGPVPTGRYPVILAPQVVCGLLAVFAGALSGDAVAKGNSPLVGKVGEPVGSERFCLRDDGLLPGGWSSEPFDDEGTIHRTAQIVEKGILRGYLVNLRSAARLGVSPSGNGSRHDFKNLPAIQPSNLYLVPPAAAPSFEQLVSSLHRGLVVDEAMGFHTLDPVSGDISVGASGFIIDGGAVGRAFRSVTVAGNLYDLIRRIDGVARDLRFYGGVGSPSLLIEYMDVAGQE